MMNLPSVFRRRQAAPREVGAIENLDFVICESADAYQEKAKEFLTSHALAEFKRNPLLYHKRQLGLVPDEDRPAYLVGRAAHVLTLEGREAFVAGFAVGGPINPQTGNPYGPYTKAFQDWAAQQGKPVLDVEQAALVEMLAESVQSHEHASHLLSQGIPEAVVRTTYREVPCQARLDWLNPREGIVDLKTCDSLDLFEYDVRAYGYAYQLAFYRALLAESVGGNVPVFLIAVEKKEPFRTGVWRYEPDVLDRAQRENERAVERFRRCRETANWPSGFEEVRVLSHLW